MWLTKQAREQSSAQPIWQPQSLVSPVTGWNTRDALDAMAATDAVEMDNWYPDAGGVYLRNGYQSYATGLGSTVQTLAEFNSGTTRKFLGASNGSFYDISLAGAVGAPLASGFTGNAWQWIQFLGRTFFVNGQDTMQVYDGTSFSNAGFTGVSLATLSGCVEHQQRLYFWDRTATGFWFAPLNSINGALSFYDLSAFLPQGGNLIAAANLSYDGGTGVLDYIVFITSSGWSLLFAGNDPSDVNNWSLIGRYRISPPVSPRAICSYGGEAFVTTFDDHVPFQQQFAALRVGQIPPRSKVSNAVQAAVIANPSGFGWQALYYPRGRRLIFNIPNPDGTFDQHVQNTANQAWCRFGGLGSKMNAQCFGLFKDQLYFGGSSGVVYLADIGNMDLMGAISGVAQQAWNTFQNPFRKRVTAVRPVTTTVGTGNYVLGIGFDYGSIDINVPVTTPESGSPWNTSPWNTSPWSPEAHTDQTWHIGGGTGQAIGLKLSAASAEPLTWLRTDLRFEQGNGL